MNSADATISNHFGKELLLCGQFVFGIRIGPILFRPLRFLAWQQWEETTLEVLDTVNYRQASRNFPLRNFTDVRRFRHRAMDSIDSGHCACLIAFDLAGHDRGIKPAFCVRAQ